MNTLDKTGVPIKGPGDSLTHQDINDINSTVNLEVDAINYLLKTICNINAERNDFNEQFTLDQAINIVPESRRQSGLKIRFLGDSGEYLEYIYQESDVDDSSWLNISNWSISLNSYIDGGEW